MNKTNKTTYMQNFFLLDKMFNKQLLINRAKIHRFIFKKIKFDENQNILDIGTTSELNLPHNYLIHALKDHKKISCISNQDCTKLKTICKNLEVFFGDGRDTELKDHSFDIVYCSATIEHVGSKFEQINLLKECCRLSKKKVIITTPNRYFPLDFHTKIPFLHFLPKKLHRFFLKVLGLSFFAKEENLNLLSKKDLLEFCHNLGINDYTIYDYKLMGLTSNLILIINTE